MSEKLFRIGELSRRVGVSVELLRAWERRYGLLAPERTRGGFRLYGDEDVSRVLQMRANLDRGFAAAEAARLVVDDGAGLTETALADASAALAAALESFDDAAAQAAFDRLLSAFTVDVMLEEALLPYLRELGDRWQRGEISVAQEHFASNLVRSRLVALSRGWDRGEGPRALLACVEGEQHDLPLVAFGLLLRSHGWRICYLGASTPIASVIQTAQALEPSVVVLSGTVTGVFDELAPRKLREVGRIAQLYLAGAAADEALARAARASHLGDDLVAAARVLRPRRA